MKRTAMALMPLSTMQLNPRRREPRFHVGHIGGLGFPGALGGGTGMGLQGALGRAVGGMGAMGMAPYAGAANLAIARGARGLNPLYRPAYGALGPAGLMRRGISNRDLSGSGSFFPDDIPRGAQYPGQARRNFEDLLLSPNLGHLSHRDFDALLNLGSRNRERDHCECRGCRSRHSCGHDRRCEHERCAHDCSRCSEGSSGSSSTKDLNTKDIVVRGKTYKIRRSFLQDSTKFESEITKLLDKKSEESVPDDVVQMLVDYINTESCTGRTILDLVSLNILASNLGVKSGVEYSLNLLKREIVDYRMRAYELTEISLAIMESSKVDDKLVEWLRKYLRSEGRSEQLARSIEYHNITWYRPELARHLAQLVGEIDDDEDEARYRVI